MEDSNKYVLLDLHASEILNRSRSAFCHVLEGKFGCTAEIHNVEDQAASSFTHSKAPIVPEIVYSKQLSKNLKISVWKDDLTTHMVDAVVNAANEKLNHGGGLALALCQAGGPKIQILSDDIIKYKGQVQTSEAVLTGAGNLPCKHIIHAVGPCVSPNASASEISHASTLLQQTIMNIFRITSHNNLQSIAIPAISSGLYNFPRNLCADIIVKTVKFFSDHRNTHSRSLEIRLVNHDNPSVKEMQRACKEILGPSESVPVQDPSNAPKQPLLSGLDLGNVTLHLKKGTIEHERADVIVNTAGTDLDLSVGLISKAILNQAGPKIQDEIKKQQKRPVPLGAVIATAGYKLKCKEVYHTVCAHKTFFQADKALYTVIKKCLEMAVSKGHSSINFPAIGTGNLGFRKDEVSHIMTQAVLDFSSGKIPKKINVCFVIFPKDSETLQAFENVMAFVQQKRHTFNTSSNTSGKSSDFHDSYWPANGLPPCVALFAPSPEALREAKLWCFRMLQKKSSEVTISNNHVVHFTERDHARLTELQDIFNINIKEFFMEGKGGIIIRGEPLGVGGAALEVEAMLCQAQEDLAQSEETDMKSDLEHISVVDDPGQQQQIERLSHRLYQKTQIDLSGIDRAIQARLRNFDKCDLKIVKVEKIENPALKQLFELTKKRIQVQHRLYQRVNAQFCDLICRVGFQKEYAPPQEQKYGAGIYFTDEVSKAKSLWKDNVEEEEEEYLYFVEALVLTGKEATGSPGLIVPPVIESDPLDRYDSVSNQKGIHVIFNGQQAYPDFLITCKNILKSHV